MDPERWKQVKLLCQSVLEVEREKREVYLEKACAGEESLRKEVEALLANQVEAEVFLNDPAIGVAAEELARDPEVRLTADLSGRKVVHYQIVGKIGEGGMGVVYRARDTRLARDVAIKVLPESFSGDRERVARFEREARLLATLNHPNIASVYGLEEAEGRSHLVLELVEGKTLAERLKKGRIRLDETLEICCQIAAGLEAAHERGIIHRDLKPSNIKLTPEGKVKILDFGLAKALYKHSAEEDLSQSQNASDSMTDTGVILGTAAYMSPEQARGKPQDKRTDIWAFGCILYECLTCKQPFRGETVTDTLAAVISAEPDWNALPKDTPGRVGDVIRHCLQKDPDHRLHDIADARIELEESSVKHVSATGRRVKPGVRRVFTAGIAAAVMVLSTATWFWISRPRQMPPMTVIPLIPYSGSFGSPTFSPTGDRIAFHWDGEQRDNFDIYVSQIGLREPMRLTTDPAADLAPSWSPDGNSIAFVRRSGDSESIYLIPAISGAERPVAELSGSGSTVTWSSDGKWLVAADRGSAGRLSGLHLISVETGEKRRLTSFEEGWDLYASFSPDRHSIAFVRGFIWGSADLYRISLTDDYQTSGKPERLTYENGWIYGPAWTHDGSQILYSSGKSFRGPRILRRITLSEPPNGVGYNAAQESYGEGATDLAISPAGRRLVYVREYSDTNIYRIGLPDKNGEVGTFRRFIASAQPDREQEYSPDGRMIAFASARSGSDEIWVCNADGSKPRQLTSMGSHLTGNPRWSPDCKTVLFQSPKEGSVDLYLIDVQGGRPRRLTSDPGAEGDASWSRDGKWVYFLSDRTGRSEVYKMPAGGGKIIQVTKNGGSDAFESPDGKWLYYSKDSPIQIWRMPIGGGEERLFHAGPLNILANLVVVDDGIYFTKATEQGGCSVVFIDFENGKTRTLGQTEKGCTYGLAVSPDRRWVLCTLSEEPLNNLMLVENFR